MPVDIDLIDDSFEFVEDGVTKTVDQKVIVIEDVKYRVPISVIKQLKVFLAEMPSMKHFRVKKTGTTKADTIYTVIPLTE